jgi:hypothetical protein
MGATGIGHVALGPSGITSTAGAAQPFGGTAYEDFFPYYAELCALSELRKKPGFGVPLRSGIGGHSLLYLNGVRLDRAAGYPTLRLCAPGEAPQDHGVGISVNSHYRNANWVAIEGRDFLWRGALASGERLTREAYERTQAQAKAMGVLDGVKFHEELFRAKPAGMTDRDYMYEISVATDYAAQFGRDTFRARVPLDRARMGAIVEFLNGLNAPYRDEQRIYRWRVLNNNCAHVAHNALAAAGLWDPWPTGQFFAIAAFKFPVPKNEFVDLVLRTSDLPIEDAQALYEDAHARRALLSTGTLPTVPGALASVGAAIGDNDIYDVARLRLIFYDNPFWGPYRHRLKRIFTTPRYIDLHANLRHFADRYAMVETRRGAARLTGERALFQDCYEKHIAQEAAKLGRQLAMLEGAGDTMATP